MRGELGFSNSPPAIWRIWGFRGNAPKVFKSLLINHPSGGFSFGFWILFFSRLWSSLHPIYGVQFEKLWSKSTICGLLFYNLTQNQHQNPPTSKSTDIPFIVCSSTRMANSSTPQANPLVPIGSHFLICYNNSAR